MTDMDLELRTSPVEIQNVVLVAEPLPNPAEIDLPWVTRHHAILSTALLDEFYRDVLETIEQHTHPKRDRFYEHVRANILHYQRAIWRQEDPEQRSMRYRKWGKKVPLEWRFELESGTAAPPTIVELGQRLTATSVDGQFAAYATGRAADLDQVIDPAGLIGYYANYAIYRMRPEFECGGGSAELFSMLHFFKALYAEAEHAIAAPEVMIAKPELETEWMILRGGEGMLRALAGTAATGSLDRVILVRDVGAMRRLLAGGGAPGALVAPGEDEWLRPNMFAELTG